MTECTTLYAGAASGLLKPVPIRILFVGEAPAPSGKEGFEGESFRRLAGFLGTTTRILSGQSEVLNVLDRYPGPSRYKHNVEGGKGSRFPLGEARKRASIVLSEIAAVEAGVVLFLGRRSASTLVPGLGAKFFELFWWEELDVNAAVVPHPSGVNRWYNFAQNVLDFRRFMLEHPLVRIGGSQ